MKIDFSLIVLAFFLPGIALGQSTSAEEWRGVIIQAPNQDYTSVRPPRPQDRLQVQCPNISATNSWCGDAGIMVMRAQGGGDTTAPAAVTIITNDNCAVSQNNGQVFCTNTSTHSTPVTITVSPLDLGNSSTNSGMGVNIDSAIPNVPLGNLDASFMVTQTMGKDVRIPVGLLPDKTFYIELGAGDTINQISMYNEPKVGKQYPVERAIANEMNMWARVIAEWQRRMGNNSIPADFDAEQVGKEIRDYLENKDEENLEMWKNINNRTDF